MTVSILKTLATLPSGAVAGDLTYDELGRYLAEHYGTDAEKDRNNRHALRDELYRDGGVQHMYTVIERLFQDPDVRKRRQAVVPLARFNNALKRIVNEMSTVYSEPAKRVVASGDENYQTLLERIRMDERMVEVSRLLNLHRALLVGFRVRQKPDGTREPVLDIATPANVRAVMHPNDDSLVVGWLIRNCHKTARKQLNAPAWTLWTDHESAYLRDDLSVIGDTWQEHKLGVCPWVPVTLGPPGSGFWPGAEGEDMVAGHVTIWLENVLLIKESKSATKQTIITGDGTAMARGQSADSETPGELADGQSATTVDMSMDLEMFQATADHVLNHLAQNYGMSPALITHQGVQSAEARDLMRLPLREIRRHQQVPLRRFEHALAVVMAAVLKVDLPELGFDPTGWRMEFGESETPLDPLREFDLFEKRSAKGLDNELLYLQRLYPGIAPEDAMKMIEANILIKTEIQRLLRPFMAISGALGARSPMVEDDKPEAQDATEPPEQGEQDTTADDKGSEPES